MHSEEIWVIANLGLGVKFQDQAQLVADALRKEGHSAKIVNSFDIYLHLQDGCRNLLPKLESPIAAALQVKDTLLAKALESLGVHTVNSSEAIKVCDDKALTHLVLSENNIPFPTTVVPPEMYPGQSVPNTFITQVEDLLGYPIIVKASKGSFGKEVFRAQNRIELQESLSKLQHRPLIFQRYIPSIHNSDLRIQVIDGEAVAAVQRMPNAGEFRANLTLGAAGKPISPGKDVVTTAIKASQAVGTLSAGVDLIVDPEGRPLVLEVNSNAHLRRISEITGVEVAGFFARALIKHLDPIK